MKDSKVFLTDTCPVWEKLKLREYNLGFNWHKFLVSPITGEVLRYTGSQVNPWELEDDIKKELKRIEMYPQLK